MLVLIYKNNLDHLLIILFCFNNLHFLCKQRPYPIKIFRSFTPLNSALNVFNLQLNNSALALVLLSLKKFSTLS